MANYRRVRIEGGTCFFTVVTAQRRRILQGPRADLLLEVLTEVQRELPFDLDAFVVLPDHLHALWRLPDGDSDYSRRWGLIKTRFSKRAGLPTLSAPGRYSGIWQPRFWEHSIRDDEDWRRHMDYVHHNPVKHGLATRAIDWPHSSFRRYVEQGFYDANWGVAEDAFDRLEYGE